MTAKQINAWFKEWIEEKRFLMNNDEPIRLYDLAEFFAFCEEKSEETEIVNYGHTEAFAMAQIGREGKFFLMGNIIADIDEQPTVIEAEGRTDDKTNKGSSC